MKRKIGQISIVRTRKIKCKLWESVRFKKKVTLFF
jgi:hypothetical protein